MFSFSALRKRNPTEQTVGGASRIPSEFPAGNPLPGQSSSPFEVVGVQGNFYHMHEGDIFEPGTGNWVLDPFQEWPIQTNWGHAFLVNDSARQGFFRTFQPPQIYVGQNLTPNGLGGLVSGQLVSQPLSPPEGA